MKTDYDVVVIGAGVIGTMTAKTLAEQGRHTLLLERRQLAHKAGSSHGLNRIVRVTDYHPDYVRMNRLALRKWEALQDAAGETLLVRTGNLEIGEDAQAYADALEAAGEAYEWLAPEDARARWPGLRLGDDERMFVQEDGGVCLADRTVRAAARLAIHAGAELREDTEVERVADHDTFAEVVTPGRTIRSSVVVVTAGAWAGNLLSAAGIDLPLVPSLEQVSYYRLEDPSGLPTVIDYTVDDAVDHYAVPHPSEVGHFKLALDHAGPVADPGSAVVRPGSRAHGAGGGVGAKPVPLIRSDGGAGNVPLYEHTRQRLRVGSNRVDRRGLRLQRARLQGEPDGGRRPGRPGDGPGRRGAAESLPQFTAVPATQGESLRFERGGPRHGQDRFHVRGRIHRHAA